jgi:hypothetical protein
MDGKERGKLKRMRRARGGRTLPRSGSGVHEDKKSKKLERQLEEELDDEIENWEKHAAEEFEEDMEAMGGDIDDEEFWDEWKYPYDEYDEE